MRLPRVRYAWLRRAAGELLGDQTTPPVDVHRLAAKLGAEVRSHPLDPGQSGVLYREGERKVIVVNAAHAEARQRFSIAHEIGHLLLHRGQAVHVDLGLRINLRDERFATNESLEEVEANAFAANLLMPAEWLRRGLKDGAVDLEDERAVGRLARRYGVSPQAMIFRLTSLGPARSMT